MNWSYFANPRHFLNLKAKIEKPLLYAMMVLFPFALYEAFLSSPPDYKQGETVRIMYIHVPAAWMAMQTYVMMAVFAFIYVVWKHNLAGLAMRALAPIGAAFTVICLMTGSLWGEPMWGTWWVWDARLTSVLVLLFFYVAFIALANAFDDSETGEKAGAILVLVGVINLPIIKFSVDWWNTLHQPASILRKGGIAIDPSMQVPLFSMMAAFFVMMLWLFVQRLHIMMVRRKRELNLLQKGGE